MQKYDYIIAGTGASGLMVAYYMMKDSFFDQKKILLIDKEVKNQNDRTWCFWEEGPGTWEDIIYKRWSHIDFVSTSFSDTINIVPYQYKYIRSKDFYRFVFAFLEDKSNITIVQEKVINLVDEGNIVSVETDQRIYLGNTIFTSIPKSTAYKTQQKYPLLYQHFIGWFIKTETPVFDKDTATFMDFDLDQKGSTRFMYVLPTSETEALFEYTLFSKDLLTDQEYEQEISSYLEKKGITNYTINEKEKGCIPMTCYEFRQHNSKNVLHIGTAGGWTKPSTGFTFRNTEKKVEKLLTYIKQHKDVSKFERRTKFWYYDLWFLDLLSKENQNGAVLFSRLFRKNKTIRILKFLDEETTFVEDLKIMAIMPTRKFLKMIWARLIG